MDSEFEKDEGEVKFLAYREKKVLGYDKHLPETRDGDHGNDIEIRDEVETPFNDLSKKYGTQSIGHEAGPSSMGNSSNDGSVKKVRIDYRQKNNNSSNSTLAACTSGHIWRTTYHPL